MPYLKVLFQNQSIQFLLRTRRHWVDALPKGSVSKSITTYEHIFKGGLVMKNVLYVYHVVYYSLVFSTLFYHVYFP